MSSDSKIFFVIPAFNEEKTVFDVVSGIKVLFPEGEVIVVDDASKDGTAERARAAGATIFPHTVNRGYNVSIKDGFRAAIKQGADIIVTCDADGQHHPEDIARVLEPVTIGTADIAVGERSAVPHVAEVFFSYYTKVFFGVRDPLCGLKAYNRAVYERVGYFDHSKGSLGVQLILEAPSYGLRVAAVPIRVKERPDESRFYFNSARANFRVLRAMWRVIRQMHIKKEKRNRFTWFHTPVK